MEKHCQFQEEQEKTHRPEYPSTSKTNSREQGERQHHYDSVGSLTRLEEGSNVQLNNLLESIDYLVEDTWFIETISWLFSFCCFVAVIAILWRFDHQDPPQLPYDITVGTLVALFTTLSTTALMVPVSEGLSQLKWLHFSGSAKGLADIEVYDQASRGIWGSLVMIFSLRGKTARLGSILTILVIAASAVTQQSISYPPRLEPDANETAVVPVSLFYNSNSGETLIPEHTGEYPVPIDRAASAAMLSGIFHNQQVNVPFQTPQCSTGNCTWTSYRTLAICSSVEDVSGSIKTYFVNETEAGLRSDCQKQNLVVELPGVTKFASQDHSTHAMWSFMTVGSCRDGIFLCRKRVQSMMHPHLYDTTIAGFYVVSNTFVNKTYSTEGSCISSFEKSDPKGVEINLHFCVKELGTEVRNGVATTRELSMPVTTFKWPNATTWNNYTPRNATAVVPNFKNRFTFSGKALEALLGLTIQYLNGTWHSIPADSGNRVNVAYDTGAIGIQPIVQLFPNRNYLHATIADTSDYMEIFSKFAKNLAATISNSMRSDTNSPVVKGEALVVRTKIHVSWAWISLLAVLVVGSLVFFLLVVWMSRSKKMHLWRSSSIALLHAVDPAARTADLRGIYKNCDMNENANKTRFELRQEKGVWKFVGS